MLASRPMERSDDGKEGKMHQMINNKGGKFLKKLWCCVDGSHPGFMAQARSEAGHKMEKTRTITEDRENEIRKIFILSYDPYGPASNFLGKP